MPPSSREVLYSVLDRAILEIRAASSSGPMSEDVRRHIWSLAYLIHNWPSGLRDASTDDDLDRFLAYSWRWCPTEARDWFGDRLHALGVDMRRLRSP